MRSLAQAAEPLHEVEPQAGNTACPGSVGGECSQTGALPGIPGWLCLESG